MRNWAKRKVATSLLVNDLAPTWLGFLIYSGPVTSNLQHLLRGTRLLPLRFIYLRPCLSARHPDPSTNSRPRLHGDAYFHNEMFRLQEYILRLIFSSPTTPMFFLAKPSRVSKGMEDRRRCWRIALRSPFPGSKVIV